MNHQLTPPYYQASTYATKKAAGKAYAPIERIIRDSPCELSAYRFLLPADHRWYVVVIGEQPDEGLHKRLETILTILSRGRQVSLDQSILTLLLAKRTKQLQKGVSWQEKHGITLFTLKTSPNDPERN